MGWWIVVIFNSLKMIFVHIHKAGGSSVEVSLEKVMRWNDIIVGSTDLGELIQQYYNLRFGLEKHSSARSICNAIDGSVWASYFKWATVRSPHDRVASLYRFTASLIEPLLRDSKFPTDGSVDVQNSWLATSEAAQNAPWNYPTVRAYLVSRRSPKPFSEYLRSPHLDDEPAFQTQSSQLTDSNGRIMV